MMLLDLAGLRFEASRCDAPTARLLEAHLPEFVANAADFTVDGDFVVTLRAVVDEAFAAIPLAPFDPESFVPEDEAEVDVEPLGRGRYRLSRIDLEGTVDVNTGEASVTYSGLLPSLLTFLRVTCALVLAPRGGVLFHASSVRSNDRALLFAGPSGAGKTTIARLGAPRGVLSDEISAVRRVGDRFWCFPTPFWGEMQRIVAAPRAELCAISFPVQSSVVDLRRAPAGIAFARLLHCALLFGFDETLENALIESCAEIVRRVPCRELLFREEPSFWRRLDEAASQSA